MAVIDIHTVQALMVSIMTVTPVHIVYQGRSVNLVDITISLHVIGVRALASIVGFVIDRARYRLAIWTGIVIFLLSLVVGALWPEDMGWIETSQIPQSTLT